MDKNGNITISYDTWKDGIQTPYTGMGDIVNVDIFSTPGVAKIDYAPTEVIGEEDVTDGDTTAIRSCAIDTSGNAIFGTSEGDVLEVTQALAVTERAGTAVGDFQHAVEWKGYTIFADVDTTTDSVDLSAFATGLGGDSIEYDFESMPTNSSELGDFRISEGALCVGIDDILYVGSGRYVGSITEDTTFDPTDSNTYTPNMQALDLPEGFIIDSMINFNDYLLIFAGNPDTREQAIFPWDRVSASYDYPTPLNNGVAAQAIASQNLAYFSDGIRGQFRVTNRSNVEKISEFYNITFPNSSSGLTQEPDAITLIDDEFLVGVSNDDVGTSPIGVYKIKGGVYTRQTLSEDLDGSNDEIKIHFIRAFDYTKYLVGWENDTDDTFGVDLFGKDNYRYTGYRAKLESLLYQPGLILNDKSYQQVEINLAKPLSTGQGIKVSYRKNTSDSWTELGTYDFATYGAVSTINSTAGIIDVSQLQVKVEMTTGASPTTSPELISVKLF